MKTLLIIESPGKKGTLEKILGPSYDIRASYGHIRDLPETGALPRAPGYELQYVVPDRSERTVDTLRDAASRADRVLLATDPDREGEAIAWHLSQELGLAKPERVTYQEITAAAVQAAVANPRPINLALVRAQETRRGLDRLIGWKASAAIGNALGETVSAGRVQSPALSLVVERERQIRDFKPTAHYAVQMRMAGPADSWTAAWLPALPDGESYVLDRAVAEKAAAVRRLRVVEFGDSQARKAPPAPFTTSTLQQRAQTALKLKPKQAMEVAQKLYEQGAITYMRTDTPNVSVEAYEQIVAYAKANHLPPNPERRVYKAKAGSQEAHEAIRPTHIDQIEAGTTDEERALYRLIWNRAVASQLADATYATRTAVLEADDDAAPARYTAKGRTLLTPGWKVLTGDAETDDADEQAGDEERQGADNPIPALVVGHVVVVTAGTVVDKSTKAPSRFTLATLGKAMEQHGIGRPSTYASILDALTARRGYLIEDKKGFLSPSLIAEMIVQSLSGVLSFIDLTYTRELEEDLDAIARGEKQYLDVVTAADMLLEEQLLQIGRTVRHPCPACGAALRKRNGPSGAFWGCSTYPACKASFPDKDGAPSERVAEVHHHCPHCAKRLRRMAKTAADDPKGRGYDFWVCTGGPTCTRTFPTGKDGLPVLLIESET